MLDKATATFLKRNLFDNILPVIGCSEEELFGDAFIWAVAMHQLGAVRSIDDDDDCCQPVMIYIDSWSKCPKGFRVLANAFQLLANTL